MDVIKRFEKFYENLSLSSVDDLSSIYHPDIVFEDPVSKHKGLVEVESYFLNLLENTSRCDCKIQAIMGQAPQFSITWQMTYAHPKLNSGNEIKVDGITHIQTKDDRIIMHRDYFDLGQMIYEQLPILRNVVKSIKNRMNA